MSKTGGRKRKQIIPLHRIEKFRQIYTTAPCRDDILAAFPGFSWKELLKQARLLGIRMSSTCRSSCSGKGISVREAPGPLGSALFQRQLKALYEEFCYPCPGCGTLILKQGREKDVDVCDECVKQKKNIA